MTTNLSTSSASYEEGNDNELVEEPVDTTLPPSKRGDYFYQDYPYVRPTDSIFGRKKVKGSDLFPQTQDEIDDKSKNILVTGFGMRNVDSFEKVLKMSQDERRKWELRKMWRDERRKEDEAGRHVESTARSGTSDVSTVTDTTKTKRTSSTDFDSQTETSLKSDLSDQKKRLDYLMGLETGMEEDISDDVGSIPEEEKIEEEFKVSYSKATREAQRYLRSHRIFECFQFIIAHLLSAKAENPIECILNLLNKCLLYRSGLGAPPLLYDKKHIAQLFTLMDKMQEGSIEMSQYFTGMHTLGMCTFNEHPETTDEGTVRRETFIEEAYEAELAILDDLIRRRIEKEKPQVTKKYQIGTLQIPRLDPPYFIPSDLFKTSKTRLDVSNVDFVEPSEMEFEMD